MSVINKCERAECSPNCPLPLHPLQIITAPLSLAGNHTQHPFEHVHRCVQVWTDAHIVHRCERLHREARVRA
eukprot:1161971-Pelagomonas_calceolata.AAC.6